MMVFAVSTGGGQNPKAHFLLFSGVLEWESAWESHACCVMFHVVRKLNVDLEFAGKNDDLGCLPTAGKSCSLDDNPSHF